jgi:uncharacterized Zn finger protein (UPF0148 family)
MSETIMSLLKGWEHCPDCGALLLRSPGSLYCSHCGFEEMVIEEAPLPIGQRPRRQVQQSELQDEPQAAAA